MSKRVINPSAVPRIPVVRCNDRELADWCNQVRRAIEMLAHSVPTVGFARRRGRAAIPDLFEPVSINVTSGGVVLNIQPGYVHECIPESDIDGWEYHAVYQSGEVITTTTDISVTSGHTVYCVYDQTEYGAIRTTTDVWPRLASAVTVPDSVHWYPPDPEDGDGGKGTMYVPLYKITVTSSVPSLHYYHLGPIDVFQDLWYGENVGSGSNVYKEQDETARAKYEFRRVLGNYGLEDDDAGDSLELDFDAESVGGQQEVLVDPPDPPTDTAAQFRTLAGRGGYISDGPDAGTVEQIQVLTDTNVVRVLGNGHTGTLAWVDCDGLTTTLLEWNDGLVITSGDQSFEAGCDATTTAPP